MNLEIKAYNHFGKCLWADNGIIKLIIPLILGIRIINYSFIDGENMFFEQPPDASYLTYSTGWRLFGGTRLWCSPETSDTYYPDQEPIEYGVNGNTITLEQPVDPLTKFKKRFLITLNDKTDETDIVYEIQNCSDAPKEAALWVISAMDGGGVQTVPLKTRESDPFTPLHSIKLWEYTDLSDERVRFTKDAFTIKHKPLEPFFKIGFDNQLGTVSYANKGCVFTKDFSFHEDALYPDGGVNYETYMCRYMNELETLSPVYTLAAGQTAQFSEKWRLKRSI